MGVESGGFSRHQLAEAGGAVHVYRDVEELVAPLHTGPLWTLIAAAGRKPA